MKLFNIFGVICASLAASGAYAVSAGSVTANTTGAARGITTTTPISNANTLRGNQGLVNAYKTNQRNNYYMVNVPDVDTACRTKINKCLSDYCGDITVVPGQVTNRCAQQFVTESELYNYVLLCLRNDTTMLLPNYAAGSKAGIGGVNTAAHLCPSYVQQEIMAWLSMANMADDLAKTHSPQCLQRRQELEAALSCHSIALAYGNETSSMLMSQLNDFCGAGVTGGSAEMVSRFANAGNVGANIWGWAEKIVSLDLNKKASDWETAVDAVLASYTNRMNLACGEDMQLNTVQRTETTGASALQTAAAIATGVAFPAAQKKTSDTPLTDLYFEVSSRSEIYDAATANQVVQAGLTNSVLTQNAFLSSAQMDDMQRAYKNGTKVFIIRDSSRCYTIPVDNLTSSESSMIAQQFSTCVYK
ncbi:MAG: hypothetical protein J6T57_01475 [Alphaproteobacteria bacterium]|nr:hypothetical protein [Alphaproteobacteria bacterium]